MPRLSEVRRKGKTRQTKNADEMFSPDALREHAESSASNREAAADWSSTSAGLLRLQEQIKDDYLEYYRVLS